MRLEARKYLTDIQAATERIARFTQGKRFEHYLAHEMLRSAVERQFGIVGEALSRLARIRPTWPRSSRITPRSSASGTSWFTATHRSTTELCGA
jgi:Ribonuclease HepT-like